jgi:hypothetical protein
MLGWDVYVYRQSGTMRESKRFLLARWSTNVFGIRWIDDLVKNKQAADLGGDGYPCRYSVAAGILLPLITDGIPSSSSPPVFGENYILPPNWQGKIEMDPKQISECPSDEQLLVEAWDQS